jgi:hypothetical protein
LGSCSRKYDLELCSECTWVEIPTADGINLLIGNQYFSPDTKSENITEYFPILENILNTNNLRVILIGAFNAHGLNWERGSPLANYHYSSKVKGDATYTSTCLPGLRQWVEAVADFTDLKSVSADSGLVKPDTYPLL